MLAAERMTPGDRKDQWGRVDFRGLRVGMIGLPHFGLRHSRMACRRHASAFWTVQSCLCSFCCELPRVKPLRWSILGIAAVALLSSVGEADEPVHTFRAWDSFAVGAWKRVRIVKQSFDAAGGAGATSAAEARTTLLAIDSQGVTLRLDVTVELGRQRLPTSSQEVWYGFNGESRGQELEIELQGTEVLEIDSEHRRAQLYQLTSSENGRRRETRVHLAETFPFLLRKRSSLVETRDETSSELESLRFDVVALNMPFDVHGELRSSCHVQTVLRRAGERTHTVEVYCEDVPGWVIAHWSKRLDADGHLVEQSTLELLDYARGE